ncbi:MAG: hypothetical protein MZV70_33690 [Desulfobacterales bacterium]|nr:hypothetical protein [Desulfobacterales bacterium]
MTYFVTGATGFIGRFLVAVAARSAARARSTCWCGRSRSASSTSCASSGARTASSASCRSRATSRQPKLGVSHGRPREAQGQGQALLPPRRRVRPRGQRRGDGARRTSTARSSALEFAEAVNAGCFHLVSSIAAAGLYRRHVHARTCSRRPRTSTTRTTAPSTTPRRMVRANGTHAVPRLPPGRRGRPLADRLHRQDRRPVLLLQGSCRSCARSWPRWMPLVGIEGGLHQHRAGGLRRRRAGPPRAPAEGLDGRCFHLTDPKPRRVGEMLNVFAQRGARARRWRSALERRDVRAACPSGVTQSARCAGKPVQRVLQPGAARPAASRRSVLQFVNYPTRFDSTATQKTARQGAGSACRALEDYAWRLWDYWERHLDPDLFDRPQPARRGQGQGGA